MANSDDYNAKLDVIQAIPDEKIQIPAIPVDFYLQEAEKPCQWVYLSIISL